MSSHSKLQELMRKEHNFLYKLYRQQSGRQNRKTLKNASKSQVWVVLRILFCIAAGHIPLSRKNYEHLVRSKRKNSLRSLKNRMKYLRKAKVESQRKFILQFAALYRYLLYDLFFDS